MRWVQSSAAGVENPVFGQLAAKGVIVTNSDAQGPAIAEFILGAALDIFQRADERRQAQAERQWKRTWFRELGDTTWLIVGFGHIGRETARRLHGFGATATAGTGVGLANVRRQLTARYGTRAKLTLEARTPRGTAATISAKLNWPTNACGLLWLTKPSWIMLLGQSV